MGKSANCVIGVGIAIDIVSGANLAMSEGTFVCCVQTAMRRYMGLVSGTSPKSTSRQGIRDSRIPNPAGDSSYRACVKTSDRGGRVREVDTGVKWRTYHGRVDLRQVRAGVQPVHSDVRVLRTRNPGRDQHRGLD